MKINHKCDKKNSIELYVFVRARNFYITIIAYEYEFR